MTKLKAIAIVLLLAGYFTAIALMVDVDKLHQCPKCKSDAYNGRIAGETLAGALELEFIPETLELVSAKIIKIENFPTL